MTTTTTTRRSLLAGIPAAATAIAPAMANEPPQTLDSMTADLSPELRRHIYELVMAWLKCGDDDPVFEAIEAHRQALRDWQALCPVNEHNQDALLDAADAEQGTLLEFLWTEPTTIAGCLAALEFASSPIYPETHEIYPAPVLAPAFISDDMDVIRASSDWPAMIARRMRVLIEMQAWFGKLQVKPPERMQA